MTRCETLCRWAIAAAYHTWLILHEMTPQAGTRWLAYAERLGLTIYGRREV